MVGCSIWAVWQSPNTGPSSVGLLDLKVLHEYVEGALARRIIYTSGAPNVELTMVRDRQLGDFFGRDMSLHLAAGLKANVFFPSSLKEFVEWSLKFQSKFSECHFTEQ